MLFRSSQPYVQLLQVTPFEYKFVFVSFTSELSDNAKDALETKFEEIGRSSGNNVSYTIEDKKKICDKFDRQQMKNNILLRLKYGQLNQSYNIESNVQSWSGFARAKDILEACKDYMDIIFDENIRNYEGDNSVNKGIIDTASSQDQAPNFFFYHNGIVFICNKCDVSTGTQLVSLNSAAIVNGCQSVVSLDKARQSGNLKDNVFLPIRIIETSDLDLRSQITEYLNSQTKIKDSYFLANNPFIRELQKDLKNIGYFLERLSNEYSYKRSLNKVDEYPKEKIIPLEKAIQIYVVYSNNESAAAAKRGRNEIFNKQIIDDLIKNISADVVVEAYEIYSEICKVITNYRKCRRSERNDSFLNFMGVFPSDIQDYEKQMENYIFMNTADLLVTNAYVNLKHVSLDRNVIIRIAIELCKEIISDLKLTKNPSGATKNSSVFTAVQKKCKEYKISSE